VRQAFDDFALPGRMAAWLAIAPAATLALATGRRRLVGLGALSAVALAEAGRRRAGGTERFPVTGSLLAPAWVAERALCAWAALGYRLRGGVPYAGGRLTRSASRPARLRTASPVRSPVP
jgi:hypothetical protein